MKKNTKLYPKKSHAIYVFRIDDLFVVVCCSLLITYSTCCGVFINNLKIPTDIIGKPNLFIHFHGVFKHFFSYFFWSSSPFSTHLHPISFCVCFFVWVKYLWIKRFQILLQKYDRLCQSFKIGYCSLNISKRLKCGFLVWNIHKWISNHTQMDF